MPMRPCDDGYPSCRMAEAGHGWCEGECQVTIDERERHEKEMAEIEAACYCEHGFLAGCPECDNDALLAALESEE